MYAIREARDKTRPRRAPQAAATPAGYYDPKFKAQALKVLPGEYLASGSDVMMVTVLGSCVSACLRDPVAGIGGMNHFMLPEAGAAAADGESARYGGYAMEMLINELLKLGASRPRLQAKVFGGGAVLAGFSVGNVGERNAAFVLGYLAAEGIPVLAQDLLDVCPRRVHFFASSGRALVRRLETRADEELIASERLYQVRLLQSPTEGSVELFS